MNVNLYTTLIILLGIIISVLIGKSIRGGVIAGLALAIVAIVLGIFLTFYVLAAVNEVCNFFGYIRNSCINVNEESFWVMFAPLLFSPLYWIIMLASTQSEPPKEDN